MDEADAWSTEDERTLAEAAALLQERAVARFDTHGPADGRGATLWDIASWLREECAPAVRAGRRPELRQQSHLWVATDVVDSEGGGVLGVYATAEGAKAAVQERVSRYRPGAALEWKPERDGWWAREPGRNTITSYEVTPWTLDGAS
jgi:hypothetical protein